MKALTVIKAVQAWIVVLLCGVSIILSIFTLKKLNHVMIEIKKIEQSTEAFAKTVEVYQTLNAPQGYTPTIQ